MLASDYFHPLNMLVSQVMLRQTMTQSVKQFPRYAFL